MYGTSSGLVDHSLGGFRVWERPQDYKPGVGPQKGDRAVTTIAKKQRIGPHNGVFKTLNIGANWNFGGTQIRKIKI